jgi:predicted CXXCH cytochrome family protein
MRPTIVITATVAGLFLGVWATLAQTVKPTDTAPAAAGATSAPSTAPKPVMAAPTSKGGGADKAPRPTTAIPKKGCVTAKCHADTKNYRVLHGPVNVNACDACHKVSSVEKHTFKLPRKKTELCKFCHKQRISKAPVVHKPVQTGDCLPCHNPHGGTNKRFLRGTSMTEFCKKCHKKWSADKHVVHGPVAAGACGACHRPHDSQHKNLLVAKGRDLCLGCHKGMKKQMAQAKVIHKAVEKDCTECHDAHSSDNPMQTKLPARELCMTKCHKKTMDLATKSTYKHSAVLKGKACIGCHTAHGGNRPKLLRGATIDACMSCHDKKIDAGKGRMIASVADMLSEGKYKHGPIRKGNCTGCHTVHGGETEHLLSGKNPATFYASFDIKEYSLCFRCHNPLLALSKETDAITGFRNGSTNLHYLHVNKVKQGRTCRACHSTHASVNPMHVRESVPYGNWKMPVKFTPTKTGGTCASGCHKALAYDRGKEIPLPGRRPTEPVAPVSTTKPARGATGKSVPKWMEGIDRSAGRVIEGPKSTTQPDDLLKDSKKTFDLGPGDTKNTPGGPKSTTKPVTLPAKT